MHISSIVIFNQLDQHVLCPVRLIFPTSTMANHAVDYDPVLIRRHSKRSHLGIFEKHLHAGTAIMMSWERDREK
ncbi:hypothetical protein Ct61P_15086 [Colletotrichum tofieldiae]|nr:hypothetical protein Ct61P_15086 [Colletotrichum tofieldiae]